jgi:hypothetical protein
VTDPAGGAVADPVGVAVALIAGIEPGMDSGAIRSVVTGVAGGRAKQRRLARALTGRPAVLRDGRSPAPRAVGDLLIALVKAGATAVSPPACAECGKALRTQQRRGEEWYCGVCGPVREPCAACGETRPVNSRDQDGKPRCHQCPPGDGHDPVALIEEVVAGVDPSLPAGTVAAAVVSAVPRPRRWCIPPAPAAAGSSTCTGRSAGNGCAGTAWPGPGPCPAPGAAGPANPRPATPAERRYARTAWSVTRSTSKSA